MKGVTWYASDSERFQITLSTVERQNLKDMHVTDLVPRVSLGNEVGM